MFKKLIDMFKSKEMIKSEKETVATKAPVMENRTPVQTEVTSKPKKDDRIVDTYVAGTKYRQKEMKKLRKYLVDEYNYEKYEGMSTKEIKETDGVSVWEYEPIVDAVLTLELEDDNQHDPNAIKVLADIEGTDTLIGYIPKGKCRRIRTAMQKYNNIVISSELLGGKSKMYDDFENEMITDTTELKMTLHIEFK